MAPFFHFPYLGVMRLLPFSSSTFGWRGFFLSLPLPDGGEGPSFLFLNFGVVGVLPLHPLTLRWFGSFLPAASLTLELWGPFLPLPFYWGEVGLSFPYLYFENRPPLDVVRPTMPIVGSHITLSLTRTWGNRQSDLQTISPALSATMHGSSQKRPRT